MHDDTDRPPHTALAKFAALLLTHRDPDTLAQKSCDAVVSAGIGVDRAAMMLSRHAESPDHYVLAASSPSGTAAADPRRARALCGPCRDAIRTRRVVRYSAAEVAARWPWLTDQQPLADVGGYVGVPLTAQSVLVGGLCLYSADGDIDSGDAIVVAYAAACEEALPHRARPVGSDAAAVVQMLHIRAVIEQATGIVMQQQSVSADVALDILSARSRSCDCALGAVAEGVVEGSCP